MVSAHLFRCRCLGMERDALSWNDAPGYSIDIPSCSTASRLERASVLSSYGLLCAAPLAAPAGLPFGLLWHVSPTWPCAPPAALRLLLCLPNSAAKGASWPMPRRQSDAKMRAIGGHAQSKCTQSAAWRRQNARILRLPVRIRRLGRIPKPLSAARQARAGRSAWYGPLAPNEVSGERCSECAATNCEGSGRGGVSPPQSAPFLQLWGEKTSPLHGPTVVWHGLPLRLHQAFGARRAPPRRVLGKRSAQRALQSPRRDHGYRGHGSLSPG
jgi:hypothetical protein